MNEVIEKFYNGLSYLPEFGGLAVNAFCKSSLGNTPLHVAAIQGDDIVVRILLDSGADVNAAGEHGYTPLHEAIEQGKYHTAMMLIAHGASLDVTTSDGTTARQLMGERGWATGS